MNDYVLCRKTLAEFEQLAVDAREGGVVTLVGGLIVNDHEHLFSQRRSMTRRFCPGFWDNVGGHLEGQESLVQALAREVREETNWELEEIIQGVAIRSWTTDGVTHQEFIVLARVAGDLTCPQLEVSKVDASLWVNLQTVSTVGENRNRDDSQIAIYTHALESLASFQAELML